MTEPPEAVAARRKRGAPSHWNGSFLRCFVAAVAMIVCAPFVLVALSEVPRIWDRIFGPPHLPPPSAPAIRDLPAQWRACERLVDVARAHYAGGLDLKRGLSGPGDPDRARAIELLEGAVVRYDAAIEGGRRVLDVERRVLLERGRSEDEIDCSITHPFHTEVARWMREREDPARVLEQLRAPAADDR